MTEKRFNSIHLSYLTPLAYPSGYANRVQVIKMSDAFSRLVDFKLFLKKITLNEAELQTLYNVRKLNIVEVGKERFWPRSLSYSLKLKSFIKDSRPIEIFYTRDVLLAFWLCLLCPKFKRNFFFEVHSLEKFYGFIYKTVFTNALGIISTNQKKRELIIKNYKIYSDKIMEFGNGVDLDEFKNLPQKETLKKELGLSNIKPTLLYAGRTFTPSYGSETVEEIKKKLNDKIDVVILFNKPRDIAIRYMKASDILIAPYDGKNERIKYLSSPIKVKEYMASGNPVLASDLPVIREMTSEDEVYFAKAGDPDSFIEKINFILENQEEAQKKAQKAFQRVGFYSWQNRAKTILEFISNRIS